MAFQARQEKCDGVRPMLERDYEKQRSPALPVEKIEKKCYSLHCELGYFIKKYLDVLILIKCKDLLYYIYSSMLPPPGPTVNCIGEIRFCQGLDSFTSPW